MQPVYNLTPHPVVGGLSPDLSPQQLREVLSAQPEQALAVAVHRNADEALRTWMWQHGEADLRLAIYKHYLTQRDQLMGAGAALPPIAERFDDEVARTYSQWQEGLASSGIDELTRTYSATATSTSEHMPATVQVTAGHTPNAPSHGSAEHGDAPDQSEQSAPIEQAEPVKQAEPAEAAEPVANVAPTPAIAPIGALRLPDGSQIDITSALVLIGRNPTDAAHPGAQLVSLSDERRLLSSTHAMLRLYEGNWFIDDLGSTNGTIVGHEPEGERLPAGETTYLPGPFLLGGLPFWLATGASQ